MSHLRKQSYNWDAGKERIHMVSGGSPVSVRLFSAHESRTTSPLLTRRDEKYCRRLSSDSENFGRIITPRRLRNGSTASINKDSPKCLCCKYTHCAEGCCYVDYCRRLSADTDSALDLTGPKRAYYPQSQASRGRPFSESSRKANRKTTPKRKHCSSNFSNKKHGKKYETNVHKSRRSKHTEQSQDAYKNFANLNHVCQECRKKMNDGVIMSSQSIFDKDEKRKLIVRRPIQDSRDGMAKWVHVCRKCQHNLNNGVVMNSQPLNNKNGIQNVKIRKTKSDHRKSYSPSKSPCSDCSRMGFSTCRHRIPHSPVNIHGSKYSHSARKEASELKYRPTLPHCPYRCSSHDICSHQNQMYNDGTMGNNRHICPHCIFRNKMAIHRPEEDWHVSSDKHICQHCIFKKSRNCTGCVNTCVPLQTCNAYCNTNYGYSHASYTSPNRCGSLYSV